MKINFSLPVIRVNFQNKCLNFNGIKRQADTGTDTFERKISTDKLTKESQQYQKFQKAKKYVIDTFTHDITNLKTGKKTECKYVIFPAAEMDYCRLAIADNKVVGVAEMKLSTYAGKDKPKTWPASLNADTPQIVYLATSAHYSGVGSDLVRAAVIDSIGSGKDGRLLVKPMPDALPKNYKKICGKKIKTSPVPFYKKLGFQFLKPDRCFGDNPSFMYLAEAKGWDLLDI